MVDGLGPLPDSIPETVFLLFIGTIVIVTFGVFTGLDAQVAYLLEAPEDYLSLTSQQSADSIYFDGESIELMNEVSSRSIGPDAVAAERLYCGEIRSSDVVNFRVADVIKSSSLTSVSGSCVSPVDIFVHSQPSGSRQLSEEDKDLESESLSYTCIQYAEITASPVNGRLHGLNCWKVVNGGDGFEMVEVFKG